MTFEVETWDDVWVLGLNLEEHQLWNYLISGADFFHGNSIAEVNPTMWTIRTKLSIEVITNCLAKFKQDGKIAMYGQVVWVINGLNYHRLGGNNLTAALENITTKWQDKYPRLVRAVMLKYGSPDPKVTVPETTSRLLDDLQAMRGWVSMDNDAAWLLKLQKEYPSIDHKQVAKELETWLADHPKDGVGKMRFRRFVSNAKAWNRNQITPDQPIRIPERV